MRHRSLQSGACWLPFLLLVLSLGAAAAPGPLAALQAAVDADVQAGFEEPGPALATLAAELAKQSPGAPGVRVLQLGRGLVAAGAARDAETAAAIAALAKMTADPLADADAALVRATLADSQGDSGPATRAAQAALDSYRHACPAQPGCDYRSSWRALQLLARHEDRRGRSSAAYDRALEAAELAKGAGDVARQAWALAVAADIGNGDSGHADEQRLLDQAQRLAEQAGAPALQARVRIYETRVLRRRGNLAGALAAAEAGLALARRAGTPRLAAVFLANLADLHVMAGQPRLALAAVDEALPVVRRHLDRRTERVLLHNAALARLALGEIDVARRALDELLAAHRAGGNAAAEAETLREFGDAFAAAGQLPQALVLYHRERKLAAEIMAANRDTALAELRKRFDREAQQRRLDQLARDNALITAQIDNRTATQQIWVASAALLVLAMAMVALLYRRVSALNRRLAHNHAVLHAQSQRDPLTGLANRRCLHERARPPSARGRCPSPGTEPSSGRSRVRAQPEGLIPECAARRHTGERAVAQQADPAFVGALLLIDIDHFKHVNDGHGHAAGDGVLVEVARRLAEVVAESDLVVRWGGEEFLVYMPGVGSAPVHALAERVLQAVGATPVALPAAGAGSLRVTVSIGYASFPLPPARLPLTLERAINLADMALYTAKSQGRNRAIGINSALAADADALRGIEADFDQAWHSGLVSLLHTAGPAAPAISPSSVAATASQLA